MRPKEASVPADPAGRLRNRTRGAGCARGWPRTRRGPPRSSEEQRPCPAVPLDVLGAESEGMIGYRLEQELENALRDREVATLLTRVEVDAEDPRDARHPTPTSEASRRPRTSTVR